MTRLRRNLIFSGLLILGLFSINIGVSKASATTLLRVYNPNSGEHHYTANVGERNHLVKVGWRNEGTAWETPTNGADVYRLYNSNNGGDHHYTVNINERNNLISVGWRYEGISWKSGGAIPVYRLYNPNAKTGTHHYTLHSSEKNNLVRAGWRYEGVAFYSGKDSQPSTPKIKYTVWWYTDETKNKKYEIQKGTKFFNTEKEATNWIENYSDNLLMKGISTNSYGVMSWF